MAGTLRLICRAQIARLWVNMADVKMKAWMEDARKLQWDKYRISDVSTELAALMLRESQRMLRGEERHLIDFLSADVDAQKARIFSVSLLRDVSVIRHEDERNLRLDDLLLASAGVPKGFGRVAKLKYGLMSRLNRGRAEALCEMVDDVFSPIFAPDDSALRSMLSADEKDKCSSSVRYASAAVLGQLGCETYVKGLLALMAEGHSFVVEVDVKQLCSNVNLYQAADEAARLKSLVKSLFDASLASEGAHPLVFVNAGSQRQGLLADVLTSVLSAKSYPTIDVGLELPAYLPDVERVLESLMPMGKRRAKAALSFLKIHLVKGDCLSDEWLLSQRNRRHETVSMSKAETDARYRRLITQVLNADGIEAVFSTHDLFDLSFAVLTWARSRRKGRPRFSFVRGLGSHLGRFMQQQGFAVMLHSYRIDGSHPSLMRARMVEMMHDASRPQAFAAFAVKEQPSSVAWNDAAQRFMTNTSRIELVKDECPVAEACWMSPITLPETQSSFALAVADEFESPRPVSETCFDGKPLEPFLTVSVKSLRSPFEERYCVESMVFDHVDALLARAYACQQKEPLAQAVRLAMIGRLASLLNAGRAALSACLMRDAGHCLADADEEIARAIASCHLAIDSLQAEGWSDGVAAVSPGVVAVATGALSPIADVVQAVAYAWSLGSVVIVRPHMQVLYVVRELLSLMAEAGISETALLLAVCMNNQLTDKLLSDSRVAIVFDFDAPRTMLGEPLANHHQQTLRPARGLCSVLIASDADWSRAIAETRASFVRRSGQLCSTPHVLIVAASIYDDVAFMAALKDTIGSLRVGDASKLDVDFGPQAQPLDATSRDLMTTLFEGERWLVKPTMPELKSALYAPSLRVGARPEVLMSCADRACALPQLWVLRATTDGAGLEMQQLFSANYRAVIYSHDELLLGRWRKTLPLAHAFVNSPALPEIPGLLPDGHLLEPLGMAGGRCLLPSLASWLDIARPEMRSAQCLIPFTPWEMIEPRPSAEPLMRLRSSADSISLWWEREYGVRHRLSASLGEWTELRYEPVALLLRAESTMSDVDLCILLMTALKAGCDVDLSLDAARIWAAGRLEPLGVHLHIESRDDLVARLSSGAVIAKRLRDPAATDSTRVAAAAAGVALCDAPVLANGRVELQRVCRERYMTIREARAGLFYPHELP